MRRITSMLFGVVVGGLLMFGALQYHVLRTAEGFSYVPKRNVTLKDTYLDVREWTPLDWSNHPDLIISMMQNGRKDILDQNNVNETTFKDVWHKLTK